VSSSSDRKQGGLVEGQGRAPGVEPERSEGETDGARRRAMGGPPQRLWAPRKGEAVVRVLGGEDPATVAGELGVTITDLSVWKDKFIRGGIESLKRREQDESQEVQELRSKIGELTMQLELYRKNRPAPGRSRRHSR
jgi:hypothetical protein